MSNDKQCRALKRNGDRCTNQAKFGGFCGIHLPKTSSSSGSLGEITKGVVTAGKIAAAASGAIELIHKIVELWQSLPFGPGPQMPRDYYYLTDEFGPSYPELPSSLSAFSAGADSIDWHKARRVYDASKAILAEIGAGHADPVTPIDRFAQLDQDTDALFSSMQPQLQEMVFQKIGDDADETDSPMA